jgi:hypothetical protein
VNRGARWCRCREFDANRVVHHRVVQNGGVHVHSQINNYIHKYQQHAGGCDPFSLVKYVSVCEAEWFSQPKRTL